MGVFPSVAPPGDCRSNPPIDGCLSLFTAQWEEMTTDSWVLKTVRLGLALDFLSTPPGFFIRCPISRKRTRRSLMEAAVEHLLDIRAIQPVPEDQQRLGLYSILFVVPKVSWGWRMILDLKRLNKHLVYKRFKMQSLQSILKSIREGDFLMSIDLTETYLHIPILLAHQRFATQNQHNTGPSHLAYIQHPEHSRRS